MKLPEAERAVVDIAKLRDYCLSPFHPLGRHKARIFAGLLRLDADRCGVPPPAVDSRGVRG